MNSRSYSFVTFITAAAIAVIWLQPWDELLAFGRYDWLGLAAFVFLGVLAELFAIDFSVGSNRSAKSSIAFLPLLACPIAFSSSASVVAVAAVQLLTQAGVHRRPFWLISFNTSQGVIAIFLAATVFNAFGGMGGILSVVSVVGLATSFFLANIVIVGALYSLRQGQSLKLIVGSLMGPGGGNILYGLLASPVAVLAAVLYEKMWVGGVMLMILPLLLIRYTYLDKVRLQQANRDLLRVLIKTIETRDPYTSGHSLRVSSIARAIAEDMGLSRRKLEQVETAGLLHDIGKIDMIYAAIIKKPSDLTEDERRVIKTHATRGAELLTTLTSFDDEVVRGVRHHHEHFDGTGYPDGLAGKAIPISARIIMLCDSIDAMLSDRPYRSALSLDQVRAEIIRCAGTQFDPDIVHAIVRQGTLEKAAAAAASGANPAPTALMAYAGFG